jgi:chitinase
MALTFSACGSGSEGARPVEASGGQMAAGAGSGGGGGTAGATALAGTGPMGGTAAAGMAGGPAVTGGGGSGSSVPITHPEQRTVVYLPDWRGPLSTWSSRLDYSRMTYLNLGFAEVDEQGNVSYPDVGFDAFVAGAHAAGVKVCVAIGGAGVINTGGVFGTVLADGLRDGFVGKLTAFANEHQLDCIDVDLEGNGVNQYYEAFVLSLAAQLHQDGKEMTAAVGSWFGHKITDTAIQAFDFINVMAYDMGDPGGSATPLQSSSIADAIEEVDYWVNRGLAKDKAVFGVPFYGYRWIGAESEALTYAEILAAAPDAATQDQVLIDGATTYLNSRATIQAKAKLSRAYGGIMIWEIGQDAAGEASLLKAIIETPP